MTQQTQKTLLLFTSHGSATTAYSFKVVKVYNLIYLRVVVGFMYSSTKKVLQFLQLSSLVFAA